jgi:hypothetical protein
LKITCCAFAPIALEASIRPFGISRRLFSTSLAINGAAPILKGTNAAAIPIDVPTTLRVNGIIHTISMIKGIDLNTFTSNETSWCMALFSSS